MSLIHAIVSALTPDRYESDKRITNYQPVQGPTLHSVAQEPGQFIHSLDPRTPSGAFNLAMAMFRPGPGRGGKFIGEMTPMQKAYIQQLKGQTPTHSTIGPSEFATDPSTSAFHSMFGYTGTDPWAELMRMAEDTGKIRYARGVTSPGNAASITGLTPPLNMGSSARREFSMSDMATNKAAYQALLNILSGDMARSRN